MSELVLPEPLATEVRRLAELEGMSSEEVVATAIRHYRALAREKKIRAEAEWWTGAPAELRARHAGEYVAVHRRTVVDHDRDQLELYRRVRASHGDTPVLTVPAEDPQEIRVVSTHFDRR